MLAMLLKWNVEYVIQQLIHPFSLLSPHWVNETCDISAIKSTYTQMCMEGGPITLSAIYGILLITAHLFKEEDERKTTI